MIIAIVQPTWLTNVVSALEAIEGFPGMSISKAHGFGRERSFVGKYPYKLSIEDYAHYTERIRFDIAACDEMADEIVETIVRTVRTGGQWDGMIYVLPIEQAVRIQTDMINDAAL